MTTLADLFGPSETFLDAVPTAIVVHDSGGAPFYANRRARTMLSPGTDLSAPVREIMAAAQIYVADTDIKYPLEDLPSVDAFSSAESLVEEMEIRRPDGTVHLEVRGQATLAADGEVQCIVHSLVDVSERKNTDADLRLTESLGKAVTTAPGFADVLETSLHEICQLTGWTFGQAWLPESSGRFLTCRYVWHDDVAGLNEFHQASRRLNLASGQGLPGRVWTSKQWEWNDETTIQSGVPVPGEIETLPTGHRASVAIPVIVDDLVVAVLEFFVLVGGSQDQRSLDRVLAVVSRVGLWMSSKGAEDAVGRSEQQFRKIAESATDAIVFAGANSQIIYMNPSAEQMFGYKADEVVGHSMAQLVHDRSDGEGGTDFGRYSQVGHGGFTGAPVYLAAVSKDGLEFPVEMNLTTWQQGNETFLTAIVRDSADRVDSEQRLEDALGRERQAIERLHVLDALKYTVLQTLAHDLRSPIAAVLALTGILRAYADSPDDQNPHVTPQARTKMLTDIDRSIRKMERLLQDLVNSDPMRPIEARRTHIDIASLVRKVMAENDLGRNHPIHTNLEPVRASVDAAQVERIVDNLLNNAEKYVEVGGDVWIETASVGSGVLLSVTDAGAGVPDDMKEKIFQPFRRGSEEATQGLGLGLSLVSRFAQVHGGRAWVEDRPGGGASFRVYLPATEAAIPEIVDQTWIRVLLVDDDPIFADALATLIGFDSELLLVAPAMPTGQRAIDAVALHHPDVVLMDVELVGNMTGFEATSHIRRMSPKTQVVVMTGVADPNRSHSNAIQAGAFTFLEKRNAAQLIEAVHAAATHGAATVAAAAATAATAATAAQSVVALVNPPD